MDQLKTILKRLKAEAPTRIAMNEWTGTDVSQMATEALAAVSALEEQMKALTADRANLRNFIEALVEDVCWGQGLPDDIDGGSVQDLAEKYNILKPVPHPEPCHIERCPCIESGPYDFIYHFAWSMPPTE